MKGKKSTWLKVKSKVKVTQQKMWEHGNRNWNDCILFAQMSDSSKFNNHFTCTHIAQWNISWLLVTTCVAPGPQVYKPPTLGTVRIPWAAGWGGVIAHRQPHSFPMVKMSSSGRECDRDWFHVHVCAARAKIVCSLVKLFSGSGGTISWSHT